MYHVRERGGEGRCVNMMRCGACCCDCMSVYMVMHVCGCVPGVQLGGRCCCWHGQWRYLVRVTVTCHWVPGSLRPRFCVTFYATFLATFLQLSPPTFLPKKLQLF